MKALRHRDYAILFSGQILSIFGNSLYMLALPWYVLELTGSKADLALTGVAQTLPAFAALFTGVFIDRWRKKPTMIVSDLLRAILCGALYLVIRFDPPFAAILAIVLVVEFIGTFYGPASSALTPSLVPAEDIPDAMGISQSGGSTATLVSYFAGGTLLSLLGAPVLFLLNGISFIASLLSVVLIRRSPEPPRTSPDGSSLVGEWIAGMRLILRSRAVLRIVLTAMIVNFGMAPFDITLTAWVKGPLGGTGVTLGLLLGGTALGAIVGGFLVGPLSRRASLSRLLMLGLVVLGACAGGVGLRASLDLNLPLVVIMGASAAALSGAVSALAVQYIPESMRGRLFGALGALATLAQPLGMAVYGALLVILPLPYVFWLLAAPALLAGLSFLVPLPEDILADADAPEAAPASGEVPQTPA